MSYDTNQRGHANRSVLSVWTHDKLKVKLIVVKLTSSVDDILFIYLSYLNRPFKPIHIMYLFLVVVRISDG